MNLDIKKESNNNYKNNLEGNKSRIKEVVKSEVSKIKIKLNKKREDKLCRRYRKALKRT